MRPLEGSDPKVRKEHSTRMSAPGNHALKIRVLVVVVCGEADDIPSTLSKVAECPPDLLLIGLRPGTGDSLEFVKGLKAQYPKLLILVYSGFEEAIFAERALRAGANGYLMKKATREEMLIAVRDALRGQVYVSRELAMSAFQNRSKHSHKTASRRGRDALKICLTAKCTSFSRSAPGLAQERSHTP